MDIKQKTLKGALSAFLAVAVNYVGIIAVPIIMLCVVMLLDYITGMVAAWRSRELSSKKGSFGIIKKLCYLIAVCVGIGVDWLIYSGLQAMGVSFGINCARNDIYDSHGDWQNIYRKMHIKTYII